MSFGVSEEDGTLEWGSSSLWGFIGSFSRLFSLWFWRLVFDMIRFNFFATDILSEKSSRFEQCNGSYSDDKKPNQQQKLESIGQYLDRHHYSEQFKRYYIIPMVAAPWCISPAEVSRDFPAETLIYFMSVTSIISRSREVNSVLRSKHRMLSTITHTLSWRAFKHGSKTYIDAFLKTMSPNHHLHLNTPVRSVIRERKDQASIVFADGLVETFDHVLLAVHAHQALDILGEQSTDLEREVLGAFRTSRNECVVHSDPAVCHPFCSLLHLSMDRSLTVFTATAEVTCGPRIVELSPA
jgi:predicted NAD/FAD-binding protein